MTSAIRSASLATLVAASCLALSSPAGARQELHRQSRRVMGSLAEIQVYANDSTLAGRAIAAALDEMERVDRLLSNYVTNTELSRMNAQAGKAPFRASAELYEFVRICRRYFDETLGTFDPTMGPVARAWGFFTPRPSQPAEPAAARARALAGFDKVRLDETSRSISFARDGVEIDPGGIGKGYAAARATAVLRQSGISSALVSAGGSTLYALGHPPDRDGWKIAVRDPARPATSLRFVMLRDNAISTSGVTEKFVEVNGHRYGHIIDPRLGEPAEGMCQVSVVARDAIGSDAYTKAAFLLSRRDIARLFRGRQDVHVLRVEGSCGQHRPAWTTPWSEGVFSVVPGGSTP